MTKDQDLILDQEYARDFCRSFDVVKEIEFRRRAEALAAFDGNRQRSATGAIGLVFVGLAILLVLWIVI